MSNQQMTQIQRQEKLKPLLLSAQNQINSLLKDKNKSKQFLAAALVVGSDKSLTKCSPDSIVRALIGVAMLDLNVDKNIGHCYLIPYGDGVQLQIGYKGFIQLLFRAGWLVKCLPVYICDDFSLTFDGWENHVEFSPSLDSRNEGDNKWVFEKLRGIYVVSRHTDTKDEYSAFVNKNIIEKLRLTSPNQNIGKFTKPAEKDRLNRGLPVGIWESWYVEMAQAKAIKKLAKILPIGDSRITATALAVDDKQELGSTIDYAATAESGVVIDMEATSNTEIDDLVLKINNVKTELELDALKPKLSNFTGKDTKLIRAAWSQKADEFKPAAEPVDTKTAIEHCKDTAELSVLIPTLNEAEQIEFADAIDDKYESFRFREK